MAKSENQKLKTLYIAKYLWEETDELHPVTTRELIAYLDELGISAERKAIYRDIEDLRSIGMEIGQNPSRSGGGFYLIDREFETADLKILIDLVQASRFLSKNKTGTLIKKIEKLTSSHIAKELEHEVYYAGRIKTDSKSILVSVDVLHQAISAKRPIAFLYTKNTTIRKEDMKDGERHVVSPYYLVSNNDNYYMVGFNNKKEAIRTYRVDRMKEVRILDAERKGQDAFANFSIEEYTNSAFGMFAGQPTKVRLQFKDYLLDVIWDRFGKEATITFDHSTGMYETYVDIVPSGQFYGWLAGIGEGMHLEGPSAIVDEYVKYLQNLLKSYR